MSSVSPSFNSDSLRKVNGKYAEQPKNEEFVDENGIRTIIEYALNDEGKKVKVGMSGLATGDDLKIYSSDHSSHKAYPPKVHCRTCCGRTPKVGQVWCGEGEQTWAG